MEALKGIALPPGFGFHPTDIELISHYLKRKNLGLKTDFDVIPELEIYKHEPWDLPACCHIPTGDSKWHFFTSRDRKYPNGSRSNRATEAGYWKSTGKDRNIRSHNRVIGTKKTLVFHEGRPPSGKRTDWIMHEYYIDEKESNSTQGMKDAYVLCRITKRNGFSIKGEHVPPHIENFDGSEKAGKDFDDSMQEEVLQGEPSPSRSTQDLDSWFQELLDPNFNETVDFDSTVLPASAELKIEPKVFSQASFGTLVPKEEPLDLGFLPEEILSILQYDLNPMPEITDIVAESISAVPLNQCSSFEAQTCDRELPDISENAMFTGIQLRERRRSPITESLRPRMKLQLQTRKMESRNSTSVSHTIKSSHIDLHMSPNSMLPECPTSKLEANKKATYGESGKDRLGKFMGGMSRFFSLWFGACMIAAAALIIYFLFWDGHRFLGCFSAFGL